MPKSRRKNHICTSSACNLTMRLPAVLARGAGSISQELNSRSCAANKKDDFESSKEEEAMASKGEIGNKLTRSFAFTCLF